MARLVEIAWGALQDGKRRKEQVSELLAEHKRPLDLRVDAIQYQLVHLHNLCISFVLIKDSLLNFDWWDRYFPGIPGPDEKMQNASRFNEMVMYSCFIAAFSTLESYVRAILVALDREANVRRDEHFYKQRKYLYERLLTIEFAELGVYFRLMQMLRNCIHNHGVYHDPKFPDECFVYRGVEYAFKNDLPPNCLQPEFLIDRIVDAIHITQQTSSHPDVLKIEEVENKYDRLGTYETVDLA